MMDHHDFNVKSELSKNEGSLGSGNPHLNLFSDKSRNSHPLTKYV